MSTISGYLDPPRLVDLASDPNYIPSRRATAVIPLNRNPVQVDAAEEALAALRIAQTNYRKTVPAPVALRPDWAAKIVDLANDLAYCADAATFELIKRKIGEAVELSQADWYSDGWDEAEREAAR